MISQADPDPDPDPEKNPDPERDPVAVRDPAAAKAALRAEMQARRRAALDAAGRTAAARAALAHLDHAGWLKGRPVIAGFWPLAEEFDAATLLCELAARGHGCALPAMAGRGRPLVFRRWAPGETLARAGFGTHEPPPDRETVRPDLLLCPLLAFDRMGGRLGYGGGFYDRSLAELRASPPAPPALGLAFAAQEIPAVPMDQRDQRLDGVVTEREAFAAHTV